MATMLERLGFPQLVEKTLTVKRVIRAGFRPLRELREVAARMRCARLPIGHAASTGVLPGVESYRKTRTRCASENGQILGNPKERP